MNTVDWKQWNTDYANWENGLVANDTDVANHTKDINKYQNEDLPKFFSFCSSHTPEEALLYFFYWIATSTQPNTNDNILGLLDDQTKMYGAQMSVNARNTTLSNDLQNLVSDSDDGVPVDNQVTVATAALGQLITEFKGDSKIQEAYDPSTSSGILQQLQAYQTEITNDFGKGKLFASFDDMKTKMNAGDQTAVAAYKVFTDASQILTSLTQNMSAALNQKVSQCTGMEKNWQSFFGSLMKSMLDEMNSIIQNMGKG